MAALSPVMGAVREHAETGGLVLGHLQRLPGAHRGASPARRAAPQRGLPLRVPRRLPARRAQRPAVHLRCYRQGQVLRMPIAHGEGNYEDFPRRARPAGGGEPQVVFRYVSPEGALDDAWNANGSARAIAGVDQRARQRARPDAASRALRRGGARQHRRPRRSSRPWSSAGRADGGASAGRVAAAEAEGRAPAGGAPIERYDARRRAAVDAELARRARPVGRGVRAPARLPRPRSDAHRARHHLGAVVRALLLQVLEDLPARVPDPRPARRPGPGRERRRRRHRPRLGGGLQDGVAQPPELHRALPGRGDRRRRHPARRLHHGRAPDRLPRLAALRRDSTRRACARWSTAWCAASATTATASAFRRWAARPASIARYNGNILVNAFALGVARRDRIFRAKAGGRRQSDPLRRQPHRPRRHPRRDDGVGVVRRREPSRSGRPCRSAIPFIEKILLEACLEAMRTGAIVAIQDMGAAGLTSSVVRDGVARRRRLPPRSRPGAAARARPDGPTR